MKIPPKIRQQILEVRRNNPQLTANMSDEDIVLLFMQADLTLEHDKPMTFLSSVQKKLTNQPVHQTRSPCLLMNVEYMANSCSPRAAGLKLKDTFWHNWKEAKKKPILTSRRSHIAHWERSTVSAAIWTRP